MLISFFNEPTKFPPTITNKYFLFVKDYIAFVYFRSQYTYLHICCLVTDVTTVDNVDGYDAVAVAAIGIITITAACCLSLLLLVSYVRMYFFAYLTTYGC